MTSFAAHTYTLKETVSAGRSFVLYRASRDQDGLPVIIKASRDGADSRELLRQLEHEAQVARDLDPRWVVRPLALERNPDRLILEDRGGGALAGFLDGPMEVGRFLRLAVQLAAALAEIHRHRIIHKDIKPSNIIFSPPTGEVRITDFGIASLLPREQRTAHSPALLEGTLAYVSPEQTGRMNRAVDHRSDLYSLGVTFYEMLTGRLPCQTDDPLEWVHFHIARSPRPPVELVPDLPRTLSDIVMRLLAKVAEERYQTALGLLFDLERCRRARETGSPIEPFPLGERDVSDRLEIPQKLYGRERELIALLAAYERTAAAGHVELSLVSGYSGIGKSSLVNELHKPIVRDRGLFVAGKFDQYKRDIPYATFAQAFRTLVQHLLCESEEKIAAWRQRLQEALGTRGQLVVDVIPELELVVGRQPPVPDLPPAEAQNRFHLVFRRFVGALARKEHPLALFLDDLQWADVASLGLLKDLVSDAEMRHLFVVGAYRDNEVSPAHPLTLTIEEARKLGARVSSIVLGPIGSGHLAAFVGEALHRTPEEVAPLAELVLERTLGNPFFAIQFLTALHEEGLIELDERAGGFRWDLSKIRSKGFTDNVVDLMIDKLRRLPPATQAALKGLACLGSGADIDLLAMALDRPEPELHRDLWDAARAGLVLRVDGAYKLLHDRVQEAAYSLVPEGERAAAHLAIGRRLASRMSDEAIAERVFEVVSQYGRGIDLVTDPAEREALFKLEVLAGTKAKAAIAHASAQSYLRAATALLPPDAWSARYESTLALQLDLAECEYLAGDFQRADERFDRILQNARSDLDRARAHRLRMRLYQIAGRYEDAVKVTLEALRLVGVTVPESEEAIAAATEAEIRKVAAHLAGRNVADLVDAPMATDERVRAIIGLIAEASPLVYTARPALWPLLTARGVNLCLQRGHAEESAFVYSCYTMVLVALCRDVPRALALSEMALALNEKLRSAALRGKILFHHAAVVQLWSKPFAASVPLLEQAFLACLHVGDLICAGYLGYNMVWIVWEAGEPLDRVIDVARRFAAFAAQTHNDVVYQVVRTEEQLAASLKGGDGALDEASSLASLEAAGFGLGIAHHHILKEIGAYLHERYDEALEHAEGAGAVLREVASLAIEAAHHFFHALALAAVHARASADRRREIERALADKLPRLAFWADNCPENFHHRRALVEAEVARIEGRDQDAMRLYEEAIASARESGSPHGEAIACEVASRFYRGRGFDRIADTYLRDARASYARWGADAKVKQIDRSIPRLFAQAPLAPTATFVGRNEQLDLLTVIRASQAISGRIVLEELIETLMRVVLENAGAQRASLLLVRCGGLRLSTAACVDEQQGVSVRHRDEGEGAVSPSDLPLSLLTYVRRSRERVLLSDAAQPNPFAADEYLALRKPRSVLCLPILRQAELLGLLYLENNLVPNAFTPDRLSVLEVLAGQAAISLDNARLYADLRRENGDRRQAEAALRQSQEQLQAIIDNCAAAIYVKDVEGRFLLVNRHMSELFHTDRAALLGKTDHDLFPRERADAVRAFDLRVLAAGTALEAEEIAPLDDGLHTYVSLKAPLTDASGKAYALCGISTDITERTRAAEQLRTSLHEKTVLLQEVHHRVKNNLQLVCSLLSLQATQIKDPRDEAAFLDVRNRVRAMSLVHESLYRARDLASIRLADHLEAICDYLYGVHDVRRDRIALSVHVDDAPLDLDRAMSCGLIVNELVSNAIKHAFPEQRRGSIAVRFDVLPGGYSLSVADDGVGLPPGVDPMRAESLGLQLVADLVDQLTAALAVDRGGGTAFTVRFGGAGEGRA